MSTRAEFIQGIRAEIASRRAQYRGAALARMGLEAGVLTRSEFRALDSSNRLPGWVLDELREGPASEERDIAPIFVLPGGDVVECPAPILGPDTLAPSGFKNSRFTTPKVAVYGATEVDFYAHNFVKVAARSGAVLRQLSDPGASGLWPVVSSTAPHALPGKTLVIVVEGSAVLSHWLYDTLPRIKAAELAGHPLSSFQQVLLAAAHAPYHRESLARLGLPLDRVVTRAARGVRYRLDEAVFVGAPREGFIGGAWLYDEIRALFAGGAGVASPERVFISRSRASRRRITNEEELRGIAEARGYRTVFAEDHSIREFAGLLSRTRIFVGPHGAGHANIAFMPRAPAAVAELFGAHISREYWCMSSCFGFRHHLLEEDGATDPVFRKARETMPFMERNGRDLSVSSERFRKLLDLLEEC